MAKDKKAVVLTMAVTLGALSSGCNLTGVGSLSVAACETDLDCAAFNAALPQGACARFVCDANAGECVAQPIDNDGDDALPLLCGGLDCDDNDPSIGPRAEEICGNDIDEDCSGMANDLDCDGADACADGQSTGCDCDDHNASIGPAASEVCNGIDDNCNGLLDGPDEDDDGDGHADQCAGALATDCDDEDARTYTGAPELCDGIDNDCVVDGVWRILGGSMEEPVEDRDLDGHSAADARCLTAADDPSLLPKDDCSDRQPRAHPGAADRCDGIDNDCDGVLDNVRGSDEPGGACVPTDVSAGRSHTCAIRADGAVICWGSNSHGELGSSDAVVPDAIVVVGLGEALDVVSGNGFSCVLQQNTDGGTEVACWGREQLVRGGLSSSGSFGLLEELAGASALSAGEWHSCALIDGSVWCWGLSRQCQVNGAICAGEDMGLPPTRVSGIDDAVQIDAGMYVSCAVREGGEVTCWGNNDRFQLGNEEADHGIHTIPGINDAEQVACGNATCCVIRAGGSLSCWGDNTTQALGLTPDDEEVDRTATPIEISGDWGSAVEEVYLAAGGAETCSERLGHGCARLASGELLCWGQNRRYTLGPWTDLEPEWHLECWSAQWGPEWIPFIYGPRLDDVLADLSGLSFGGEHVCGISSGRISCRGNNSHHQLGRGNSRTNSVIEPVTALIGAAQTVGRCMRTPSMDVLCAGAVGMVRPDGAEQSAFGIGVGQDHVCLLREEGTVRCSGVNSLGQLGRAGTGGPHVIGLDDAVQISCGSEHCCVARRTGQVACWGNNESGQLGVPDAPDASCDGSCSSACVPVAGIDDPVLQVAAGADHTCALDDRGQVYCWGDNARGQVGAWTRRDVRAPHLVPVSVQGDPVVYIAASALGDATCAVLRGGAVRCWGEALHESSAGGSDPWTVPGLDSAAEASMTRQSLCVRLASGAARCYGLEGFDTDRFIETVDLGCGPAHCCLTRTSGQTLCWGQIPPGLAGEGAVSSAVPVQAVGLAMDE